MEMCFNCLGEMKDYERYFLLRHGEYVMICQSCWKEIPYQLRGRKRKEEKEEGVALEVEG